MNHATHELLKNLYIPEGIKGFTYIGTALNLIKQDVTFLDSMTGDTGLYSAIATYHHTLSSRVERAIRHAIELASSKNSELFKKLFPGGDKPSNKNFLSAVAYEIDLSGVTTLTGKDTERKFNIIRGVLMGSYLETAEKREMLDFINELEQEANV